MEKETDSTRLAEIICYRDRNHRKNKRLAAKNNKFRENTEGLRKPYQKKHVICCLILQRKLKPLTENKFTRKCIFDFYGRCQKAGRHFSVVCHVLPIQALN